MFADRAEERPASRERSPRRPGMSSWAALRRPTLHRSARPEPVDGPPDRREQLGRCERLGQIVGGAGPHRGHGPLDRWIARDHEDLGFLEVLANVPHQFDSRDARHLEVGDDDVDRLLVEQLNRLGRAGRAVDAVVGGLQIPDAAPPGCRENRPPRGWSCDDHVRSWLAPAAGSRTSNLDPLPGLLVTEIATAVGGHDPMNDGEAETRSLPYVLRREEWHEDLLEDILRTCRLRYPRPSGRPRRPPRA